MVEYVMPALTDYPDWQWRVTFNGNEVYVGLYDELDMLVQAQTRHHHSEYEGSAAEVAVEVGLGILIRLEAVEKALRGLVLDADAPVRRESAPYTDWVNNQLAARYVEDGRGE